MALDFPALPTVALGSSDEIVYIDVPVGQGSLEVPWESLGKAGFGDWSWEGWWGRPPEVGPSLKRSPIGVGSERSELSRAQRAC